MNKIILYHIDNPLFNQWKAFTLEHYAEDTGPDEHVKIYVTHVGLYMNEDVVMCKAFPTTLKGPVMEWFTSLPPYSIDCFNTLPHLFTTQFVGSCPHQATPLSLLNARQEKEKTLRAFIDCFEKVALQMKNLTQEMMLQCMALALKHGIFVDNVCLRPPTIMHELKLRATYYI